MINAVHDMMCASQRLRTCILSMFGFARRDKVTGRTGYYYSYYYCSVNYAKKTRDFFDVFIILGRPSQTGFCRQCLACLHTECTHMCSIGSEYPHHHFIVRRVIDSVC